MDIIDLITNDHATVDELFRRYNLSAKAESRQELADQIVRQLSIHAAIEEQFVYPLLRVTIPEGRSHASESIDEHADVKRLLADLEKQDPASDQFHQTMESIIENVREHVADEEKNILPTLRERTRSELRQAIGAIASTAKNVVPTHPHPNIPGTATAQLVAGPWAAAVDRVRDLVESR